MHISDLEHTLDEYNKLLKDIPSFVGRLCFLVAWCVTSLTFFRIFLPNGSIMAAKAAIVKGLPNLSPMHPTIDIFVIVV
jgi:hypothetical protein